jgi:hypothetical protein
MAKGAAHWQPKSYLFVERGRPLPVLPPPGDRCKYFDGQLGTKVDPRHSSNALGLVILWEWRRERRIGNPSHTPLWNAAVRCQFCRHQETAASPLTVNLARKLLLGIVVMRWASWFSGNGEGSGALATQVIPLCGTRPSAASFAATRRPLQVL